MSVGWVGWVAFAVFVAFAFSPTFPAAVLGPHGGDRGAAQAAGGGVAPGQAQELQRLQGWGQEYQG